MFHEAKCDVERSLGEIQAHCCAKFVASIKFGAGRIYHGRPCLRATKKTDVVKERGKIAKDTRKSFIPFLRKSILYARSIFAIAKSPILLRIERRRDRLLRRSNHDRFTDRARAPRHGLVPRRIRGRVYDPPPFLLRLSLREISSLCPLNCSFPVQKRSQPPDCETPSIRNFNANVRFKSTRNSSEYKYRNWRENFFKRKSLDFVLHLETKIINSKVSYFKLASIFFFFFFASIIDATRD